MPSIKDLKKRIGTVKNTQQTTRAMKMVSAAKLRKAQEAIQNQRPYAKQIGDLISHLSSVIEFKEEPALMRKWVPSEDLSEGQKKKILLVVVTSDRGLCGGFNSNVIKAAQRWVEAQQGSQAVIEFGFVGKRGYDFFKNRKVTIASYFQEIGGKVTFGKAKKLADYLIERFVKGEFDEIKFVYNEFKNAASQVVRVEDFLPLVPKHPSKDTLSSDAGAESSICLVKPSPEEVFEALLERNFSTQAFRVLLESQAGEHGARMSAMENATKNAGEMIRKLTLQYNKQRQAGITKELLEIIAGSESQKEA